MSTYKRGDIWWYRFKFRGENIRVSSKSKNKGICERLEREHRRKLELNQGALGVVAAIAMPLLAVYLRRALVMLLRRHKTLLRSRPAVH